ncbi:hypothetical protein GCM10011344_47490 [Dokdonia pacifica]|uniref:DUF1835 domain-containing protein n=1 Tax=Dokdonia pacifica TaxID=1627892 RepID=A0A239DVQ0_9FLAO|nr:DUF1835 domain-containing protein [Dokdonia pacifica]GGG41125.1 hypothetical protein GCM10011344_47490 [Dokdonia pacifica]SNS35694.1 hypothetical protein SAMN06265376_11253 [Dokdonia pacifica]
MTTKTLHITNGDSLNDWLLKLQIKGDFAVWREMLCEGKTTYKVGDQHFKNARKAFLKEDYDIDTSRYDEIFGSQLELINNFQEYDELVLWFEYDLFCHINMMACISYLVQRECKKPIYLVCSGRISGEKELKGLSEITEKQLLDHYKSKVLLTGNDLLLSDKIWRLYCSDDHSQLQPILAKDSSFIYLSNCISAHKKRFPEEHSGLNTLELHILKLLKKHQITSERQLCGYVLNYQGYYGYGDTQISKMIKRLHSYYEHKEGVLVVNQKGENAIKGEQMPAPGLHKECYFGGVSKYAYTYNKDSHQITKV